MGAEPIALTNTRAHTTQKKKQGKEVQSHTAVLKSFIRRSVFHIPKMNSHTSVANSFLGVLPPVDLPAFLLK